MASASSSSPARWPRTGSRCCRSTGCFGGTYTAHEIEQQTGLPAERLIRIAASARAGRARARRPRLLRRGHRGRPLDQAVPRRRASPRTRSPRSRACSARGCHGWRRRSPRRSSARSWQAGDTEEEVARAVRGAGRAADAGARADPGARLQAPTCATASGAGCSAGASSRPATPPASRSWRSASPIWSGSRGSGSRSSRSELGVGRRAAGAAGATRSPQPPVRLIKTIGDAAMFVCPDPAALVAVALDARRRGRGAEAAEPARRDRVRPGAAAGRRLLRQHGQPRQPRDRRRAPGQVLCTPEVRDAARDDVRLVVRRAATASRACPVRCRCTAPAPRTTRGRRCR